jgi:hypothetical protein
MKAGPHAGEGLDAIIARKRQETASAGWCLWGGGSACHPLTQADAREWTLFPEGTPRHGSKWALVLRGLARTCQRIDLGACHVAVGPSADKNLEAYLRGRCGKACAVPAGTPGPSPARW